MSKVFPLKEGEVLDLLSKRRPENKDEIAIALNITPNHLSSLYRSEFLTKNIKERAAEFFGCDTGIFKARLFWGDNDEMSNDVVEEPRLEYQRAGQVGELTAAQVLKYLEEKDKWFEGERVRHYEERARLLGIIENLTKK